MLGLVGLGKMGRAMAERLAETGSVALVWDIDPGAVAAAAAMGHRLAGSAAEVAAGAGTVLSIVTDAAAVRGLFLGPEGFLSADCPGRLFVEMSTVPPALARELAPKVAARGAAFVDCPVMGTIPKARAGSLLGLAGGAPDDIARAWAALAPLTRAVELIGPSGQGYAAKLCANLFMGCYLQAAAEAASLAEAEGIGAGRILALLMNSPIASPWLSAKTELMLGGEGEMSLDLRSLRKDLAAAVGTANASGRSLPATAATLAEVEASVKAGAGLRDLAAHAAMFVARGNRSES